MFAIRVSWWRPVASRSRTRGCYFASITAAAASRNPGPPAPFSTGSVSPTPKRVGTHNGSFHCDEALGCFLIRLTDKFSGAEIVRTRDPQANNLTDNMDDKILHLLETLDAVLDVGGVYDPSQDHYDHHQKGFGEIFGHGFNTKLSSAGLVYKEKSGVAWVAEKRAAEKRQAAAGLGGMKADAGREKEEGNKKGKENRICQCHSLLQHYGKEIIAKELQLDVGHENVQRLYLAVYKSFIEAIDAVDNGINEYDTDQPPKYVNNTHLSSRVGRLNLDWMDPDQSSDKENAAFQQAMMLAGGEFLDSLRFHARSWIPARSIVAECIASRGNVDPSGEIMVLDRFCPVDMAKDNSWCANVIRCTVHDKLGEADVVEDRRQDDVSEGKEDATSVDLTVLVGLQGIKMQWKHHLFELEEELKIEPLIKYVLYQPEPETLDERSGSWRVQTVAVAPYKFESRKQLPPAWRGLRDQELSDKSGIPGCVFVHINGFIGGNQTYDGALAMAKSAVTM
ncbi:hypothetical protein ZIOFF_045753 [Zingiber officinale]|uniref:Metal-dependent protein hydrolase n=1 Tax=Zingiber officinale TaxID=94328 RepID=A0A8J5KYM5_ZINOF|nr:hypothetical protein ZIOFF_045753 [Zingiber officinale]